MLLLVICFLIYFARMGAGGYIRCFYVIFAWHFWHSWHTLPLTVSSVPTVPCYFLHENFENFETFTSNCLNYLNCLMRFFAWRSWRSWRYRQYRHFRQCIFPSFLRSFWAKTLYIAYILFMHPLSIPGPFSVHLRVINGVDPFWTIFGLFGLIQLGPFYLVFFTAPHSSRSDWRDTIERDSNRTFYLLITYALPIIDLFFFPFPFSFPRPSRDHPVRHWLVLDLFHSAWSY